MFCFISIRYLRSNIVKMIMFRNATNIMKFMLVVMAFTTGLLIYTGCESPSPRTPRIDFVEMSDIQPHADDPGVIWYDDFNEEKEYMESTGIIDRNEFFGIEGGSMDAGFYKGDVSGRGNRKLAFGDFPDPDSRVRVVSKDQKFDEIYWRIYVKHEYGWEGSPAKMSRATSIVSGNWQQAMIAHVWSGGENTLTLDPARGVEGQTGNITTSGYNDFDNLSWLGNEPASSFEISSTDESGYWVPVEASAKLNTPGRVVSQEPLKITRHYPPALHTFAVSARKAAMENGLPGVIGTSHFMFQSASR